MSSIKTVCTVTKPTSKGPTGTSWCWSIPPAPRPARCRSPLRSRHPWACALNAACRVRSKAPWTSRCRRSAAPGLAIGELRSLAIMMISKSRKLCPGSVRPSRMLPNESFEQLSFRIARCLAPPDRITSGPRALTVTAYAVGRSSSHHSGCNRGTRAPVRDDELRGG